MRGVGRREAASMQRPCVSKSPCRGENAQKLHGDFAELQRRFAFLTNVTSSSLEQIRLVAEGALKELHEEGELPAWSRGRNGALRELVALVERAQRDVQLASTSLTLPSCSATATPHGKVAVPLVVPGGASIDSDEKAREDEVFRAHQLACVLQERNTIKESLMNTKGMYASLQQKFSILSKEHSRLLQTLTHARAEDATAADADAAKATPLNMSLEVLKEAMRQLYDRRVRELEEEVMSAREEVRQMSTDGDGRTHQRVASAKLQEEGVVDSGRALSAGKQREDTSEKLRRQNTFLRNKLVRLREELHVSQQAAIGSAEQLREGLGRLLKTITGLQQDVATKERQRADALLLQEEATQKAERLAARVTTLEGQVTQMHTGAVVLDPFLSKPSCGARCVAYVDGALPTLTATLAAREAELRQAQRELNDSELRVSQLTRALAKAQELLHDEETSQVKLQLTLSETQGMWEAAQAQLEHMRAQETMLARLEGEVRRAVEELLHPRLLAVGDDAPAGGSNGGEEAHLGVALQRQLDGILQRLRQLEGLELQLRQRDDAVVILQDENAELEERNQHLQQTLSNLSLLFHAIPQTPLEVEELVVERDVLLAALQRCEELAVVPNVKETCRSVELRKMELAARQTVQQRSLQSRPQLQQRTANSSTSPPPEAAKASATPRRGKSDARLSFRSPSILIEEQGGNEENMRARD
ncbi:hypothetical protein TraAM80_03381 [Trypanosoma rangeli]|uniref:Uncharacterized protein n=1 Tax=Trypanosoma rangeli TaxID=5698 RepID=A0A422NP20_TRYRA|nr:uncharacterized protein TraAM80_03381 [Trypanosoma rangeli]RNF07260.1 hypothetical protein TraAM80_03381 [Trypanosoma rangeli]|eukprot:RNF07260.1 hypothetical protein TraAM80_03381 [Trypanosoma rangeli]